MTSSTGRKNLGVAHFERNAIHPSITLYCYPPGDTLKLDESEVEILHLTLVLSYLTVTVFTKAVIFSV